MPQDILEVYASMHAPNKRKKTKFLIYLKHLSFFIILICSVPAFCQELSLREIIEAALQKSPQIMKAQIDEALAKKHIQVEEKQWLPRWQLSFHADAENHKSRYDRENRTTAGVTPRMVFHSIIGTDIQLQATQSFNKGRTRRKDTLWQVHIEQPLLKGLRPLVNRASLLNAQYQSKLTQRQKKDSQLFVILTVLQQYASMYTTEQSKHIQAQRLKTQENLQKIIQKKIQIGRMAEVDGLMHELYVTRLRQSISQTDMALQTMKSKLGILVGLKLEKQQHVSPIQVQFEEPLEEENYLVLAKKYHLEPLQWDMSYLKKEKAILDDNRLWDLRLKGIFSLGKNTYHYDKFGLDFDPQIHEHTNSRRYVGLFLNIPLSKDYQQDLARYHNKSAQYKRALDYQGKELALEIQVHEAYQQIDFWNSQKMIADQAHALSKKRLTIEEHKYLAGRSNALEWENAQESELQAALDVLSAQMGVILAYAELEYLCGILDERWQGYV